MEGPLSAGLPPGEPLGWTPRPWPEPAPLDGAHVTLRPLDVARDAEALFAATRDPTLWTYLYDGPYPDLESFREMLGARAASLDPMFFAVVPRAADQPQGYASYLRITPEHGVIEIGNILFGTPLQRTTGATEAIYLLARHAFDELGYRRLEWKCNALNAPSRRAAERFGFRFEGVFAQHVVVKDRNRDTAWYAITDVRWPAIRAAFEAFLAPDNFDPEGRQRQSLRDLTAAAGG